MGPGREFSCKRATSYTKLKKCWCRRSSSHTGQILIHFLRFSGALGRLAWTCGLTRTWGRTLLPNPGAADTVAGMDAVEVTEDFLASGLLKDRINIRRFPHDVE